MKYFAEIIGWFFIAALAALGIYWLWCKANGVPMSIPGVFPASSTGTAPTQSAPSTQTQPDMAISDTSTTDRSVADDFDSLQQQYYDSMLNDFILSGKQARLPQFPIEHEISDPDVNADPEGYFTQATQDRMNGLVYIKDKWLVLGQLTEPGCLGDAYESVGGSEYLKQITNLFYEFRNIAINNYN